MTPETKPVSTPENWNHHKVFDKDIVFCGDIDSECVATFKTEQRALQACRAVNRDHLFDELVEALDLVFFAYNQSVNLTDPQNIYSILEKAKELLK